MALLLQLGRVKNFGRAPRNVVAFPPTGQRDTTLEFTEYTSIKFTERVAVEGFAQSIGTAGDAYDAARDTVFGLFKNNVVDNCSLFRTGPLRHVGDVEQLTLAYIHISTNTSASTANWTTSHPRNSRWATTLKTPAYQPGADDKKSV